MTNNPNEESTIKGWQLLGLCSGVFPPSSSFQPFIMSFCHEHQKSESNPRIREYARYSLARIDKSISLDVRKEIPSACEIDACKQMDPVLMRVYHMDGSFDTVPVTSWMTAKYLNEMMAHLLGIKTANIFSVYEMSPSQPKKGAPAGALPGM
eukprot:gb/GECG01016257.1/.p1 GENE.gb/GECG01016257.1/~~gb/GECG01016257.1/.p1  ORF type:complete len:152 (+),score=13.59 gb/GECG01016257.1/:1-456(+)